MTAPTEADIRAVIDRHKDDRRPDPWDFASAFTSAVDYIPEDERGIGENHVWANLRPSEEARLNELLSEVFNLASREVEALEQRLWEATVNAAMTFAAEYPDAPRVERELVSAG